MSLQLTNPHSVLAAIHKRPQDVLEIHAGRASRGAWQEVIEVAQSAGIAVREPLAAAGGRNRRSDRGGRVGSTHAVVRELQSVELKELFRSNGTRGLWLALDRLQDPHNVGAIFRTASFFGVQGIVLTQDQSAPLTSTVYDVASGGMESVPFSLQTNLARAMEFAQKHDMWVLGSSEHEQRSVFDVDVDRKWLLVVGNEEKGLRRLTLEKCDELCCIPSIGDVTSLNVSVASGILMSAMTR